MLLPTRLCQKNKIQQVYLGCATDPIGYLKGVLKKTERIIWGLVQLADHYWPAASWLILVYKWLDQRVQHSGWWPKPGLGKLQFPLQYETYI